MSMSGSHYLAGWLGETYLPDDPRAAPKERHGGMKVLSWEPRIFLYEDFLTHGAFLGYLGALRSDSLHALVACCW